LIGETVFLCLGSNLGRREQNLGEAVEALQGCLEGIRRSSVYETAPMYVLQQPKFLNMVVSGLCRLPADELLRRVLSIEAALGRDRSRHVSKGPRVIDIDILLYGRKVIREEQLVVPHPHMKERRFVLVPLLEIEPGLADPETGRPFSEYVEGLEDQGVYIFSA
jgi:2-amino-4-hydroxy-6-hydroxymethyldihydropteridine diphosphokinase